MLIEIIGAICTLIVSTIAYFTADKEKSKFVAIIALLSINATLLIALRFQLLPGLESKGILPSELYKDEVCMDIAKELVKSNQ